jgi:ribonuclease-3
LAISFLNIFMDNLQTKINYTFKSIGLLSIALTHRSFLNENQSWGEENNERLEFLGDAVLELAVTEYLFSIKINGQNFPEGIMTNIRSSVVNYKVLGQIGLDLGLDKYIKVSKGEESSKITIVADCLEALIGAIYLDSGLISAKNFIANFILTKIDFANFNQKDAKTTLQEYTQKHFKVAPRYKLLSSEGKDHDKIFTIVVFVNNQEFGQGQGISKQEAETLAATKALENFKKK